jgi:hypothetical protein
MAISPISWPQANFNSNMDFTQLGKLGDVYKAAQADERRQTALAALGGSPEQDTATLLRSGDMGLAQLGINMRNRTTDQGREDARYAITDPREDARLGFQKNADLRAGNSDVRDANKDLRDAERLKLLQEEAERKNRSLTEKFAERHDAWISKGFKPEGPAYKEFMTNESITSDTASNKAGLSPLYGTRKDAAGNDVTVMMQPTGAGEAVETKLPPGVTISNKPIAIDRGTSIDYMDPVTRQIVKTVPKDIAGLAEARTGGENLAKAKSALPTIELNSQYLTNNIDALLTHPGKSKSLGLNSYFPTVAGSDAAGFEARLDQVRGQAFLNAYDTLRGAGQISEGEGKAATAALTRARTATSVKEFDEAMTEFKGYVRDATNAARQKATGNAVTGQGSGADDVMARARAAIIGGANAKDVRQRLIRSRRRSGKSWAVGYGRNLV